MPLSHRLLVVVLLFSLALFGEPRHSGDRGGSVIPSRRPIAEPLAVGDTKKTNYPWVAKLLTQPGSYCTGVLLGDVIATAAHCVAKNGEPITMQLEQGGGEVKVTCEKNPAYEGKVGSRDFALCVTQESDRARVKKYLSDKQATPACLAEKPPAVGETLTVTGYGDHFVPEKGQNSVGILVEALEKEGNPPGSAAGDSALTRFAGLSASTGATLFVDSGGQSAAIRLNDRKNSATPGDSGGPLCALTEAMQCVLHGVVSGGTAVQKGPGGAMGLRPSADARQTWGASLTTPAFAQFAEAITKKFPGASLKKCSNSEKPSPTPTGSSTPAAPQNEGVDGFSVVSGALVDEVVRGSPADKMKIEKGDRILRFAGKDVKDAKHLEALMSEALPKGGSLEIGLLRKGGTRVSIARGKVEPTTLEKFGLKLAHKSAAPPPNVVPPQSSPTPGPSPAPPARTPTPKPSPTSVPPAPTAVPTPAQAGGVKVSRITPQSPAQKHGIQKKDVLQAINGRSVADPAELARVLTSELGERKVQWLLITVRRGDKTLHFPISRKEIEAAPGRRVGIWYLTEPQAPPPPQSNPPRGGRRRGAR